MGERPPQRAFRVSPRGQDGPPITPTQMKVLQVLDALCAADGSDAGAQAVAEHAGVRKGSVVVVLRSLVERRLVLLHEGSEDAWAPTMAGRSRVRHARAAEERRRRPPAEED